MASGTGAQIAINRTGSLTVDVASLLAGGYGAGWQWTNFVTESIEHNLEELEEGAITGNHDAPPSHKGTDFGQGDVTFEPNPNAIGAWIYAATGIQSNDMVTDADSTGANSGNFAGQGVFTHHFIPRLAQHDVDTFNEPHGVMVYKDVGSAWFANGAVITALQFTATAGALVNARASLMAREMALQARASSMTNLVSSGGRPWIWDNCSIEIGPGVNSLAAATVFENLAFDLQIPHEGIVKLNGSKFYAQFQKSDFRRLAIDWTMCFKDQVEYVKYREYDSQYVRVTATNNNSAQLLFGNPASAFFPTLQIDIPVFKYITFSAPVGGPNRIIATGTAKGERDTATGYMIRYMLTNVVSGY
jgi:hypothetical protein